LSGNESVDIINACDRIYEHQSVKISVRQSFVSGNNKLMTNGFLVMGNGHFRRGQEISLSEKGADYFFGKETELLVKKNQSNKMLVSAESIKSKILYYNTEEQKQITTLTNFMLPKKLGKVVKQLKENNMPSGINILLFGDPGTGKTETAMQIAKLTGRDIMKVELSETKSMWFGESEKQVKKIFTNYRRLVENNKLTPILFFNEADGIFSKRKKIGTSNVAQTENAIQNIILQEMETLQGILIATTNLVENLDQAFERRFLYKIRFLTPCIEVRTKIWKNKIPALSDSQYKILAKDFNFSGAEIENIARKCLMNNIMTGKEIQSEDVYRYCKEEKIAQSKSQIGFFPVE